MTGHGKRDPTGGMGSGKATEILQKMGRAISRRHRTVIVISSMICLTLGSYSLLVAPFALKAVTLAPQGSIVKVYSDMYQASSSGSFVDPNTVQERQTIPFGAIVLLYIPKKNGDVEHVISDTSDQVISQIHAMEQRIKALPDYKTRCLVDPGTGECFQHASVTNFLFPSFYNGSFIPEFDGKGPLQLEPASLAPLLEYGVDAFLSTEFTASHPKAKYARAFFQFGGPLDGYNNMYEDLSDQTALRADFLINQIKPLLLEFRPDWEVVYAGSVLTEDEINTYIGYDLFFPIASIVLVLWYMNYHLKSMLLAVMGMMTIMSSFPIAYFIYRILLDQRMSTLNFMSVFLILGIGADDVFILTDMWKQSGRAAIEFGLPVDYESRMIWTFTRSIKTMFVTTFTTATSFLASGISVIPAIQSFGYFAASMVLANYVQVATFYFAWVCYFDRKQTAEMFKRYYEDRHRAARRLAAKESADGAADGAEAEGAREPGAAIIAAATAAVAEAGSRSRTASASLSPQSAPSQASVDEVMDAEEEISRIKASNEVGILAYNKHMTEDRSAMQQFLGGRYASWLTRHAWSVILVFIIGILVSGFYAMQLENSEGERPLMPAYTHLTRFNEINGDYFKADERSDSVRINFFWGIDTLDRSVADPDNPEDLGAVIYDPLFDLEANQDLFVQLCDSAKREEAWVDPDTERCLMRNYQQWINATGNVYSSLEQGLKDFVSQSEFDGYSFSEHVGFDADASKILWASFSFTSTLPPNQNSTVVRPHFDFWEQWVAARNSELPASFQVKQTSLEWVSMIIAESLSGTAISGMLISGVIAFLVLFGTNRNILLTTYAFVSIVGIVLSLMATLVGLGYGLGAMESIILTTSVGLSVDYVVHLAEAYKVSDLKTRRARAIDALEHIGPSIIGGAVTTMLASSMLFIAFISWSAALGQMIFLNIGLSILFSMVFFSAVLIVAGPEGSLCGPVASPAKQQHSPRRGDDAARDPVDDDDDDDDAAGSFDPNWHEEEAFDPNVFSAEHQRLAFLTRGADWDGRPADSPCLDVRADASMAFRSSTSASGDVLRDMPSIIVSVSGNGSPSSVSVSTGGSAVHTPRSVLTSATSSPQHLTPDSLLATGSARSSPEMRGSPGAGVLSFALDAARPGDPGSLFPSPRRSQDNGERRRAYKNERGETVIVLPGYE